MDGCYVMSGNRCDFKAPSALVSFLMDHDDGRSRKHWVDKPFRKLFQRARLGLGLQYPQLRDDFTRRYRQCLLQYHWVLPYPCGNALMQTSNVGGHRMWYSIKRESDYGRWIWARKGCEDRRPQDLPACMRMNEEEWKRWMEERGDLAEASGGEMDWADLVRVPANVWPL